MFVLTIALTTRIHFTSAGARHANSSNAGQKAYALAEAGVNNAVASCKTSYPDTTNTYPGDWCILRPQPIAPESGATIASFPGTATGSTPDVPCGGAPFVGTPDATRPQEKVTWWGRIRRVDGLGLAWVIQATGSVPNPTGPSASNVTRTLTVKVPVVIGQGQVIPPGILDWVYSDGPMTLDQQTNMRSPLFVDGDLTLRNGAQTGRPPRGEQPDDRKRQQPEIRGHHAHGKHRRRRDDHPNQGHCRADQSGERGASPGGLQWEYHMRRTPTRRTSTRLTATS